MTDQPDTEQNKHSWVNCQQADTFQEHVKICNHPDGEVWHGPQDEAPETDAETSEADASVFFGKEDEHGVYAGGWCAPSDQIFGLIPGVTVKRGGIAFTGMLPFDLHDWTKKQLRREVKRLRRDREKLQTALRKERKRTRKLNRAIDRLLGR